MKRVEGACERGVLSSVKREGHRVAGKKAHHCRGISISVDLAAPRDHPMQPNPIQSRIDYFPWGVGGAS